MVKVSKRGIASICIMSLSSILGISYKSGFSFGDELFYFLGIPPWSNGYTGTHYTALFSIFLFFIGAILAGKVFSGKKLAAAILLSITLMPAVAFESRLLFLRTQSGLKTIEYKLKTSNLEIRTTTDGNLDVTGTVVLTNYGKAPLSFGIRLPENDLHQRFLVHKGVNLTGMDGSERSEIFGLSSGETKAIIISTIQSQSKDYTGTGRINGPDLILFNESEQRMVGDNR